MSGKSFVLKTLKTSRFPRRFVCLHKTKSEMQYCIADYDTGLWDVSDTVTIESCCNFWFDLEKRTRKRETVWVAGWHMYDLLCKLLIYDKFESGDITLKRRNVVKNGANAQNCREQIAGALVCDHPPTIIDIDFGDRRYVRFIDLLNWGLEQKDWIENDSENCIEATIGALQDYVCMVKNLEMGSLNATAAGQGYTRFRTHDLRCKVFVHQDADIRAMERMAYYGGRCEALQVGPINGPLYYVDVKAMYSTIACTETFPVSVNGCISTDDDDLYYCLDRSTICVADVVVKTDLPNYPCRVGEHTYYPVGEFSTTLIGNELIDAFKKQSIVGVVKWVSYQARPMYTPFAQWYFSSLESLDSLGIAHMRGALKMAVNASYGKIGARGKRWIDCEPDHSQKKWSQHWVDHPTDKYLTQGRIVDGSHQYLDCNGEPSQSLPSVSATMNAYGRIWLNSLIGTAGRNNVYYYDTDGMIVSEVGLVALRDNIVTINPHPGCLTVRACANDAWIGGIKHYRLGDDWTQSGVPKSATRGDDGRASWSEIEPFTYGLWHNSPFRNKHNLRDRHGFAPYRHGFVGEDMRVSPPIAELRTIDGDVRTVIITPFGEIIR